MVLNISDQMFYLGKNLWIKAFNHIKLLILLFKILFKIRNIIRLYNIYKNY